MCNTEQWLQDAHNGTRPLAIARSSTNQTSHSQFHQPWLSPLRLRWYIYIYTYLYIFHYSFIISYIFLIVHLVFVVLLQLIWISSALHTWLWRESFSIKITVFTRFQTRNLTKMIPNYLHLNQPLVSL